MRSLSLVELAVATIGNPIEGLDRKYHLRIVGQEQVVAIELGLDRFEHVACMAFVATNEAYELSVAIEHRPNACAFADAGLATTARHRHRKQSTSKNRLLDPTVDFQVIWRPWQMECLREVGFAKE